MTFAQIRQYVKGMLSNAFNKSMSSIAPLFNPAETYNSGDRVIYNGDLHVFNKTHTGAWSDDDADGSDINSQIPDKLSESDMQEIKNAFSINQSLPLPVFGDNTGQTGPIGMIIAYMGNTAPKGYLVCDGSWYDIGLYPKLAKWMMDEFGSYSYFALSGETTQSGKFKVPDLRGEFLRGAGTNSHSNQGSGGSVGEHQNATEHVFLFNNGQGTFAIGGNNTFVSPTRYDSSISSSIGRVASMSGQSASTFETKYTSRPTNTSVLYCIKYEEYEGDGKGVQYSTEEQVIGTWIDGKPIYQRVLTGTLTGATATVKDDVILSNNSLKLIYIFGQIERKHDNAVFPVPYAQYANTNGIAPWMCSFYQLNGNIIFRRSFATADSSDFDYQLVIQYTKTTD